MEQTTDKLIELGLADAGYVYVNSDDCWLMLERNATGHLVPDPVTFPGGDAAMRSLSAYIHSKGLKFVSALEDDTHGRVGLLQVSSIALYNIRFALTISLSHTHTHTLYLSLSFSLSLSLRESMELRVRPPAHDGPAPCTTKPLTQRPTQAGTSTT